MARGISTSILLLSLFFGYVVAGGWWSGAIWASGLTPASPAVCPANAPIGCSAIQQPDYCCPSGNYCAYDSAKAVGCCPYGETCSGLIGGQGNWGQSTWVQPTTTWWQPSTVYATYATTAVPTTTVYGGIVVPGVVTQQTATQYIQQTTAAQTQNLYYGGYCSTLYADGPNLPTTRPGTCGTILVLSRASRLRSSMAPLTLFALVVQLLR